MTLSWSKLYNNNDESEFDRILPGASEAGKRANEEASKEPPNIRTREAYTENDLKKFNKMFSDGHAPAVVRASNSKVSPAAETPSSRNGTGDHSKQDQALFKKINSSSPQAEQSVLTNRRGTKQAGQIYKNDDLKQFDALIAPVTNNVAKSDFGGSTPINQRNLRFPDLHTSSISSDLGGLEIKPLGQRRIRMRYFD
jgi:hypothetical protein